MTSRLDTHEERFAARVTIEESEQCWLWEGSIIPHTGYGTFWPHGREGGKQYAHRYAYERWIGPIPEGAQLDHLCHTADVDCPGGPTCPHRRCVNPDHLEPVTAATQQRRRAGWKQLEDGSWVCGWGHPIDEVTLQRRGYCHNCFNTYKRQWRKDHGYERKTALATEARTAAAAANRRRAFLVNHPDLALEVEARGLRSCEARIRNGWTFQDGVWLDPRKKVVVEGAVSTEEHAELERIGYRAYTTRLRHGWAFINGEWIK